MENVRAEVFPNRADDFWRNENALPNKSVGIDASKPGSFESRGGRRLPTSNSAGDAYDHLFVSAELIQLAVGLLQTISDNAALFLTVSNVSTLHNCFSTIGHVIEFAWATTTAGARRQF